MQLHQSDGLCFYTFNSFTTEGIVHGIIGRKGGVSPAPWASLNCGSTVGDDPDRVRENRRRAFGIFNLSLDSMYDVWQVHSANVVCAIAPRPLDQPHLQADGILTNVPGVTLFMRFADCVPILLYDPVKRVVGLVHAGWLGTVRKIAGHAVAEMMRCYQSDPQEILAGIGPSIGPHHYEVGPEVITQVRDVFGTEADQLLETDNAKGVSGVKFDLWNANRLVIEAVGVQSIEISEICTACHLEDWYSHRGEKGRTGRFGALISLKE
jgi:YfiH family protein